MQHLGDREHRVEADQVSELERAERVVQAEARAGVDVGRAPEPFVEREAGLVQERDRDAVHDEAGAVLADDDGLVEARARARTTRPSVASRRRRPRARPRIAS